MTFAGRHTPQGPARAVEQQQGQSGGGAAAAEAASSRRRRANGAHRRQGVHARPRRAAIAQVRARDKAGKERGKCRCCGLPRIFALVAWLHRYLSLNDILTTDACATLDLDAGAPGGEAASWISSRQKVKRAILGAVDGDGAEAAKEVAVYQARNPAWWWPQ